MIEPTYLGEIELSEETLAHYGVKGMRWGRRRAKKKAPSSSKRKFRRYTSLETSNNKKNKEYYDNNDYYRDRSKKDTRIASGGYKVTSGYHKDSETGTTHRVDYAHSITGDDRQRKRRRR